MLVPPCGQAPGPSCSWEPGPQPVCPQLPVADVPAASAPGLQEGRGAGWGTLRLSELISGAPRIHTWSLPPPLPCGSETVLEDTLMGGFDGHSFVFIWSAVLQAFHMRMPAPKTGTRCFLLVSRAWWATRALPWRPVRESRGRGGTPGAGSPFSRESSLGNSCGRRRPAGRQRWGTAGGVCSGGPSRQVCDPHSASCGRSPVRGEPFLRRLQGLPARRAVATECVSSPV